MGMHLIKKRNSKYYNKYTKIINLTGKMENLIQRVGDNCSFSLTKNKDSILSSIAKYMKKLTV